MRQTRGVQRGPRSVQVVQSVRAAVLAELDRAGYAGLTIDGVAKAAGVNRTTIYRRWPSKGELLAAVVEPMLERLDAEPDTGSLHPDMLALLLLLRDNADLPEGRALAEAVRVGSAELRDLVDTLTDRSLAPFRRALDRAAERGELPADADRPMIAFLAFYGVIMWGQIHDLPPTDEDCARMLRVLLPQS
ncbi:TetR/AcrR family transcriptional regulator [Paractinoplanes durhamensis]|uniref:TetR family transcriptional regulator n=1 Tax=Paractinoplanes durhamensis TaxID=113563 RepID=A0ABQ3YU40_9ACTN|nr:TetR/AcrR family transcriptional regulator [Actinoplanes durhamensis]GIE01140.1 TetR family transcriptional regulator [Actinoplanes durhamensis]